MGRGFITYIGSFVTVLEMTSGVCFVAFRYFLRFRLISIQEKVEELIEIKLIIL